MEKQIHLNETKAKEYLAKKEKQSALNCMKKRKLYADNLTKLEQQKMNLEMQIINIETMGISSEVISSMKLGNDVMKSFQKENDIELIDNVIDDIQDNMDRFQEVGDSLSQPLILVDEDELENELNDLIENEQTKTLEDELLKLPEAPNYIPNTDNNSITVSNNLITNANKNNNGDNNLSVDEELEKLKLDLAL